MIFTPKSMIYTCVGIAIGFFIAFLFGMIINLKIFKWIIILLFAAFGFAVGTFKIPDTNSIELTRKLGGEEIDKAFIRWLKFKNKKSVIYTYLKAEEEIKNG